MRGERGAENLPPDAETERAPETGAEKGADQAADASRRAESAESLARAESESVVRETKDRIADALWERPAAFAAYAAVRKLGPRLSRFLEAFASLDDETMRTDALKHSRDAAADASSGQAG